MNKELEQSIQRLKLLLKDDCSCEECLKNKRAYETILNYIENSIPKEVVEEKMSELKKIAKKADTMPITVEEERLDGTTVYSQRFSADGYIAQVIIKVLQELLEGK